MNRILFLLILVFGNNYYVFSQCGDGMQYDNSHECDVDINCQLGLPWENEKRAVVLYEFISDTGDTGCGCTGTLINNTSHDGTLYMLTASHCINSPEEASSMVFYWNYERDICNGTISPIDTTKGAELIATSFEVDITLLKLNHTLSTLPSCIKPYFAGWDLSNQLPNRTVLIY